MAGGVALLTVPLTLARWWLSQDAVEHLAIAQAWVHGAGFVDPVKWILPAGGPSPTPALALRAPAISLLAAIPLGLGASLTTTGVLHAVWASGVAGLVVPAARRCGMRGPAAFAAALLLATSPAWLALARHVWTEATALLAFLAVLATARGTVTSARGSLLCAVTTFVASLCRPNLIALALAVLVAGAAQSGVQRAARVRGLAIYALALAGFVFAYRACVVHAIGEAPYARYQTLFHVETTAEVWQYARADHGVLAYVASHGDLLATRAARTFADLVRVLFLEPTYHGIGWLALPGFAFALRSGERALERRFLALSGLGLAFVALLYVDFDRARFPLFTAAAASLSGFAWLDARAQALERGLSARHGIAARALGWAPLVLACGPLAISLPGSLRHAAEGIAFYREQGTQERLWPELDVRMRPLCRAFAPGERIASVDPWTTHLWCGHATTMLPSDLAEPGVLEVFLAQEQPDWLIAAAEEPALRRSPRLRLRHRRDGLVLYQVEVPPGPGRSRARAWNAPPPLACAGRVERCAEAIDARARPRPRPARPARATSDFR